MGIATTSTKSHNYHFSFVVRTFKINCLSNFQEYNTVLLTIIRAMHIYNLHL